MGPQCSRELHALQLDILQRVVLVALLSKSPQENPLLTQTSPTTFQWLLLTTTRVYLPAKPHYGTGTFPPPSSTPLTPNKLKNCKNR